MPSLLLLLALLPPVIYLLSRLTLTHLLLPWHTQRHFLLQGVRGPPRALLSGNVTEMGRLMAASLSVPLTLPAPGSPHPLVDRLVPHFTHWSALYDRIFLFWFGSQPRLVITDPEAVRKVVLDTGGAFEKVEFDDSAKELVGEGLVFLKGPRWALHRRVLSPAFSTDRVKTWVPEIGLSALRVVEEWEREAGAMAEFEVDVSKAMRWFSADVIARVALGSSYEEGKRVFEMQEEQIQLVSAALRGSYIPGWRYVPTEANRKRWGLDREVRNALRELIRKKSAEVEDPRNILALMMASSGKTGDDGLSIEEMIEECKTIYFAGKETTANLLTWAMLLLGLHEDWQGKAREEVISVCGNREVPAAEDIGSLRILSSIINETLRLFPLTITLDKLATKSTRLRDVHLPSGTHVSLPAISLNYDPDVWGSDADQFDPARFEDAERKPPPGVFFPFGFGPTACAGRSLALTEAKVALAVVLRRFRFRISPNYVHAPIPVMILESQFGVQVLLQRTIDVR